MKAQQKEIKTGQKLVVTNKPGSTIIVSVWDSRDFNDPILNKSPLFLASDINGNALLLPRANILKLV